VEGAIGKEKCYTEVNGNRKTEERRGQEGTAISS